MNTLAITVETRGAQSAGFCAIEPCNRSCSMLIEASCAGAAGRVYVCPTHYAAGEVKAIHRLAEAIDEHGRDGLDELDERTEVWLAAGISRPWRVCSHSRDYGEFGEPETARQFLELLLEGDPSLRRKV